MKNARPYVENIQRRVYTPAVTLVNQNYQQYAAPKVEQARLYGQYQWEELIKPQIEAGRVVARKQYDSALAPKVRSLSTSIEPYYAGVQEYMLQAYNSWLLPTYDVSRHYAQQVYDSSYRIAMEIGFPYARWVWTTTNVFFDRTIWPRVRILYGENVEPQLVRISERLGRYRDGRKLKAVVEDIDK